MLNLTTKTTWLQRLFIQFTTITAVHYLIFHVVVIIHLTKKTCPLNASDKNRGKLKKTVALLTIRNEEK